MQRLRTTSESFHLCVTIKGNPLPGDVAWPGNIAYKVEHTAILGALVQGTTCTVSHNCHILYALLVS